MPLILIADDDVNFISSLEENLVQAGFDVSAAPNGEVLLQLFDEFQKDGVTPDAVVLDVLMPKIGGFDAAQMLLSRHYKGPLFFCSGVFKSAQHQQDAQSKYGAKAYLTKPFKPSLLIEHLNDQLGTLDMNVEPEVPQIPLAPEGGLLENPVVYLLMRIQREKHTGILDLFGAGKRGRFRLFFFNGRATLAQSPYSFSNVGVALIRSGDITGEMFIQAKELAIARGTGLYDVIKAEKWVDDATFKEAYRQLMPEIYGQCIALSGQYRWTASAEFASVTPSAPTALMDLLKAGLRSAAAKDLEHHLTPRKTLRLAPGDKWDEITPLLKAACGSDSLIRAINGRATIAQLQSAGKNEAEQTQRMRQIYLLLSTQAVLASEQVMRVEPRAEPIAPTHTPGSFVAPSSTQIPTETAEQTQMPPAQAMPSQASPAQITQAQAQAIPQAAPMPQAIIPTAPTASDEGLQFSTAELEAKQKIEAKAAAIEGKNLWEILDSKRGDPPNMIKKAYFQLARDFHADVFSGMQLGATQTVLETLFTQIAEAYAVLSNDNKREEYELKIDMEAQGMSTDIAAILEADREFHKGKLLLERGQMNAAAAIFTKCVEVNPANLEWKSYANYALWWDSKSPNAAVPLIAELDAAFKEMPAVADIAYFVARIAFEIGNLKKAKGMARRALAIDDEHHQTLSLMRRISSSKTGEQKGKTAGLMGLLKR